jgi:hypothetical protein
MGRIFFKAHQAASVLSVYCYLYLYILLPCCCKIEHTVFAYFCYMTNFDSEIPHMQKAASDPDSTFRKPPLNPDSTFIKPPLTLIVTSESRL